MTYSESIPGPLVKSKREILYKGILDELSPKSRVAFDKLNRQHIYKWNEHSFDVTYIISTFKNFQKLKDVGDNYLVMAALSEPTMLPIFLEDKDIALELSKFNENIHRVPIEKQKVFLEVINIFKSEYPDLFNAANN